MPPGPAAGHSAPDEAARLVIEQIAQLADLLHPDGRPPPVITVSTDLEADLGFDSLAVAELLVRVETAAGRRLPERALADVATVADLVAALTGHAVPVLTRSSGREALAARRHADVPSPTRYADAEDLLPPWRLAAHPRRRRSGRPYGVYARCVFAAVGAMSWLLVAIVPGAVRRWRIVRATGHLVLRATGIGLRVVGRGRLPEGGGYVVVANHASFLDPLLLAMVLPVPVTFTAVEGLQDRAAARWFLSRLHVELVPRSGDRRRRLASAGVLLRQATLGRRLVFFPEGRRSPMVGLEPFRMGAFVVAAEAGVPAVPMTVRGTRDILPVDARWPRRGEVVVEIGPAMHAPTAGFEAAVQLQQRVREWILATCGEPDVQRF